MRHRYNPNESRILDTVIISAYDDFVRVERRNLLLVSCATLFMAHTGVDISELRVLGIQFQSLPANIMYTLSIFAVAYFLMAYSLYALPVFRTSSKQWKESKNKAMTISGRPRYWLIFLNWISEARYYIWVIFHFFLPLILGVLALVIAITKIA